MTEAGLAAFNQRVSYDEEILKARNAKENPSNVRDRKCPKGISWALELSKYFLITFMEELRVNPIMKRSSRRP